jgi:hypothetical protein
MNSVNISTYKNLNRHLRYFPLIVLLILCASITFERLLVPKIPFGNDATLYSVIGHELLNGRLLYSDVWDHKPPAIFLTYAIAEIITGYGPQMLLFLNVSAALVVLLGIYWAGKNSEGGPAAGLWAATFWTVLCGSYPLEGRDPNAEIFMNACLIWAFALLVRKNDYPLGTGVSIMIGCLLTLGSFYKPIVVVYAVLFACVHILFIPKETKSRRQVIGDVLIIGLVGLLGWSAVFGYFALTDRFEIFWETMITYNRYYSGNLFLNIIAPLRGKAVLLIDVLKPLVVLAVIGPVLTLWVNRRTGALLIAFIIATWIAIAMPGQFYSHYYQLWLPPLILGTSIFIGLLHRFLKPGFEWLPHALGAVLLVFLGLQQLPAYRTAFSSDFYSLSDPQHITAESTARQINAMLLPGETFFVWGSGAITYFWSQRRPPTAVFDTRHMLAGPLADQLSARVAENLSSDRPELFLVTGYGGYDPPLPNWIADWLTEHYYPLASDDPKAPFKFYVRREGELARRIKSNSEGK